AMGEHKERLFNKDYEFEHPYSTYTNKGLPPGPIAAAGASSIAAVLDPADTEYLYFLADKEGTNHFSTTYEEHLKKRDEYIGQSEERCPVKAGGFSPASMGISVQNMTRRKRPRFPSCFM